MMRMKTKTTGVALSELNGSSGSGGNESGPAEWELRPGGMLVQKRNPDSDRNIAPPPTIRVRVKYGSIYHEINISAQSSFGDLKKMLAGPTGLHHQDQKLIFKDKERDSKAFLDMSGVKDRSKMVLVEDPISQEKRYLEMRRNAKMEKASKSISEISLEVDRLAGQVSALESIITKGKKVAEQDVLTLIEQLMNQLLKLDGIMGDGDVKLQRKMQVRRVQKCVETLDILKAKNSTPSSNGGQTPKQVQQKHSNGHRHGAIHQQPQSHYSGNGNLLTPIQEHQPRHSVGYSPLHQQGQQQPSRHSASGPVVVTTQWETFDSANNGNIADMNVAIKPGKCYNSCDSFLVDAMLNKEFDHGGDFDSTADTDMVYKGRDIGQDSNNEKEDEANLPGEVSICDQSEPLKPRTSMRKTLSDGQFPIMDLSDTLDTAWTGENQSGIGIAKDNTCAVPVLAMADSNASPVKEGLNLDHAEYQNGPKVAHSVSPALSTKGSENMEDSVSWLKMPFLNFYRGFNKNFLSAAQKLDTLGEYNPVYVSSFRELELEGGARLLLPVGVNDTVVPVYDDEPTSLIAYALVSPDYHLQTSDEGDASFSDSLTMQSHHPDDDTASESHRSFGSTEESILSLSGSRNSLGLDPLSYTKALHARVSFGDDGPLGKVKYSVTCYYANRFEALRRICCPSELDFVRSLSRCKKWGAQGGKSNVFFAKTSDDRFIIKQVTKTELESFIKFAPGYFKYLSESIGTGSPTCLAKILGIYQVTSKHLKGGKESKTDVLVMENLLFGRNVTRLYDLKGSSRSRYNPDSSGSNKVLLDQNLIEAMPTSPIFVGNKAKRLLERAVWNDTAFLASIDVMDYSLLVGVDEEKHELVLGIIDFMRQYTWDKHLETWVKASGILGGPKNASPTVISPKQYKKRFRKAMTTYFLMVPDQWSPPSIVPSTSHSDFGEDAHGGNSVE